MIKQLWSAGQRFQAGFFAFGRGLFFIARYRLWGYLLLPACLSLVLGVTLIIAAFWAVQVIGDDWFVGGEWQWLYQGFIDILATLIAVFLALIGYQTLIPLVVIPFLGPLLNRVEKITTGQTIEVGWRRDLLNAIIGGWFALRDAVLQVIFLLLSFLTGPLQPIVMAIVNSFFLGRGSFDYLLEKHSTSLRERKLLTRAYTPQIYGLGLAQFLGLLIPFVGLVLVPPVGVVAAALLIQDHPPQQQLMAANAVSRR
ncbi:EI24 domain-containing protein [Thermosynechococcus sp. QKsg1]|uniref:EI24 domain-containing protein n=1 Tax=unclassified Thermosynechococcus TaxID=2622553 RepID=UPI0025777A67|nr:MULTISPECIES: EI24 domain-containing protein [unclassified Thermosynechococcus]WJI27402.1 EI24 domain-containing protein [Thermosynechococcus sp. B1]WJI29934.1 EI24 domain-containing protein [Thermosynechococcus sp. B3]WKT84521.1 EI24 domain-containing protein [Thermosynechococcus sp. HY596]WNC63654.1 EI24 domain-containing protein [Thermosynechococcus sp. HY591]WNC66216.1 EI24 domain-containing protein [Thermosynechococcus sp. HY593]